MIKNSIIYHRLWYVKRRNAGRFNVLIRIIFAILIFLFLVFSFEKRLLPHLQEPSEFMVKEAITAIISNGFIKNNMYDDISVISRDNEGNIVDVRVDADELDRISSQILNIIQERIYLLKEMDIELQVGDLLGVSWLENRGPDLIVKLRLIENVNAELKSEFIDEGINIIKHRVYLQITTKMSIIMPMTREETKLVTYIPVADMVIMR